MAGGAKQTTTQTKDPWAPTQPDLKLALTGAQDAYNTTYQGTGVAGMDPLVTEGQTAMIDQARTGGLSNIANMGIGGLASTMANGGLSPYQTQAAGGMSTALDGYGGDMAAAKSGLMPYATGEYVGKPNPYMEQAVTNAMGLASNAANQQFSGAGRYGSGAHAGALGTSLGRIAADAYMGDYNQQQQNQLNASQALGGLASSQLGGAVSGYGALAGIGQQGISNTNAMLGAIPSWQQAQGADAQTLANIGGQRMDYQQQLIDAANENPWQRVGNLAQIATGIGGMGGTATGVTKTDNPFGAAGAVLGGLGTFANLFKVSDERAKENIKPVGKLDNGLPVYAYNYKGDGTPEIGLLAQEVEKVIPKAVETRPDGLKAVRYDLATAKARKKDAA